MSTMILNAAIRNEECLYNKKYQENWGRRTAERRMEAEKEAVTVRRTGQTPERYTQELERANRTLASENRRLIKLLMKYQEIIQIGTNNWQGDEKDK